MSSYKTLLQLRLSQNPIFSSLCRDDLAVLSSSVVTRSIERGDLIYREGDNPDTAFLILSGAVEVSRTTYSGHTSVFNLLKPPELVGLSIIAGEPHSADLVAYEKGVIALFQGQFLRDLFSKKPEIALFALAKMGSLLRDLTGSDESIRHLPLKMRVWKAISDLTPSCNEVNITHEKLAQHIGATRAKVSQSLQELENEEILRRNRGKIILNKRFQLVP